MPKSTASYEERIVELLEKMLVIQLFAFDVPQDKIGKIVGRQKAWVNTVLRGIPKGEGNGKGKRKKKRG